MTRTELENIIGGTISEEIAKEYIKATNRLVNSIIEYIDEFYSTGYNNGKHKAISIAYEEVIKLIDNAWDKKVIKIDEHMRLCKYTTSIFQKFVIKQLDNEIMNADEFEQMLTSDYEEIKEYRINACTKIENDTIKTSSEKQALKWALEEVKKIDEAQWIGATIYVEKIATYVIAENYDIYKYRNHELYKITD